MVVVRVYLDLSGYPKIGGGGLHVAHMLWGGLLLVAAVIVLQMFVGRRALVVSATAAGIGVGLFIDEVGKFITESNDCFFAPAAPLIYGAFLLLTLLWVRTRDDGVSSAAEAEQAAIDAVGELTIGRLTRHDRQRPAGGRAGRRPGRDTHSPGRPTHLA